MWNQAGGALVPLWSFLGRKQRDFLLFKLWFSDPNRKTIKPSWINLSEAKLHFVTHSQERGEGGGALSVWPFTVWLMLLLLGSLGTRQRRRSSLLRRMTCKPVSVLWKWPRTYEVSLPQKITLFFLKKGESFTAAWHRNLRAGRSRSLRAAARNGDYALNHNALVILFPKLSVAARNTWENARMPPSQPHLIVAHRSKRQPE